MKTFRVGIDVGGTFTDAVAINNDTYELVGQVKVPTTHSSELGVSEGIIQSLKLLMKDHDILPEQINFIAHGTTQATNALLEGDVAKVGIITLGQGIEGLKSKSDTAMGHIEIAESKYLETENYFIDTSQDLEQQLENVIKEIESDRITSTVATEAFSVDDPENELKVVNKMNEVNISSTAGHEVSKLYGLKVRTRTAVVNASILPKMMETANMTEESIKSAKITSPLMIMRCDGGVMSVDEVRSRPILTILSGPSAGVAGALMYEKLTDGIFLEVGGTSTDISCIKDGSIMLRYAEIGGHKTYLNSLDVRTVGVGGGSMIRVHNGIITDTGPRSAHIAELDYEVFAEEEIIDPILKTISPLPGDPEYAYIECSGGKKYALTLTGAANIAGFIPEDDYAFGNVEAAKKAWQPLADSMNISVEEAARKVLDFAAKRNSEVVEKMLKDYDLNKDSVVLVGGGGGASAVVEHLSEYLEMSSRVATNASVISPIGVALAMVRDMVERTVLNPTEQDILTIRQEAFQLALNSGATESSIEVKIEIDSQQNKIRAIATGATEMRSKTLGGEQKKEEELLSIASESLLSNIENVEKLGSTDYLNVYGTTNRVKRLLFFTKINKPIRVVDSDGIIRLQRVNAEVRNGTIADWKNMTSELIDLNTVYGDGGVEVPNIYILQGSRIIDMSSMKDKGQILSLTDVELKGIPNDTPLVVISTLTSENQRG